VLDVTWVRLFWSELAVCRGAGGRGAVACE
jgi:hypothetical protein